MISAKMMKISAIMKEATGTSTEHVFGTSAIHTDRLSLMRLRGSSKPVCQDIANAGKALFEKTNLAEDTFSTAEKTMPHGKKFK